MVENTRTKVQLLKGEINKRLNSMTTQENGQSGTINDLHRVIVHVHVHYQ